MNGTAVFRLISLIPDRSLRAQTGTHFQPDGSARMALIRRFLHWMGPLDTLSREDQQVLGLRSGGRLIEDSDTEGEDIDPPEESADPIRLAEAGTPIAA
jgi:hypothetical protein